MNLDSKIAVTVLENMMEQANQFDDMGMHKEAEAITKEMNRIAEEIFTEDKETEE